ncbi:MAG: type II toxin-antitoxin system mRNA interferase toxin, RelE/StbE family [Coleofasciculaceae cyanobacterium SM2_1_6]|nr:type II toxin-antitoxin system mRNA interferase toxin, RelE/StbE family [Coleofasciculaceae cyanobacterium SM2_1_6]
MKIVVSSSYLRALKSVVKKNPTLKEIIRKRLEILQTDPFNYALRTHKLKGSLSGAWSCTVAYDCRIVFDFVVNEEIEEEEILLINIGTHNEVY